MRIVSLLPSATEIVCEIGLGHQLVGVTHECDYPASVLNLPKVTKTLIPQEQLKELKGHTYCLLIWLTQPTKAKVVGRFHVPTT